MKSKICCLLIIVSTTYVFSQTKKEQIDILSSRIDSLNLELNKATLAIKTLESDLGGVNTQYQDCKKSKSEIELELAKKSNTVNSLNAKIDSLQSVIELSNTKVELRWLIDSSSNIFLYFPEIVIASNISLAKTINDQAWQLIGQYSGCMECLSPNAALRRNQVGEAGYEYYLYLSKELGADNSELIVYRLFISDNDILTKTLSNKFEKLSLEH